jgi:O-antigen/teichoic acid export membrane protein
MLEQEEDELSATSRPQYAQSMYRCMYQSTVSLMIVIVNIVNRVLFDYLFQENKSYGSKRPFAFIL